MAKNIKIKIKGIIENLLSEQEEDFQLERLVVSDKGRQGLVRAYIDKPGGITIDDCARISKELSIQLDVADLIPGSYRLEVSSPGIEDEEEK